MKPVGRVYGSIPHLLGSKLGLGDYHISEGQHKICTEKKRDKHDIVIVQEKYDGSNVAIAKHNGQIIALTRRGYLANTSPFEQHHIFAKWVESKKAFFDKILNPGEMLCGEWMLQAHGIKYQIDCDPFVVFDLFGSDRQRITYSSMYMRLFDYGILPKTVWRGGSLPIVDAMSMLNLYPHPITTENPEGLIYRVERNGKVEFLAKYVRPDFEPGKYLPEISGNAAVFNCKLKL